MGGLLLGLAGVVLILHDRPMSGEAGWGWLASGVSLVSITLGTLYQRRYCGKIDWRAGNLVQYIAVRSSSPPQRGLFESNVVHWTSEFVLAVAWLAVVLSIGSIGLLYWLIRRSAATSVASLFYLVPAVTALMAYVLFGERLDAVAIAGMLACAAAVFLVNRRALTALDRPGLSKNAKTLPASSGGFRGIGSRRFRRVQQPLLRFELPDRSSQRFDFLAFFFFLPALLGGFLDCLLGGFLCRDFLAAFLDFFAAFFGAFFGAAFLAAFFLLSWPPSSV